MRNRLPETIFLDGYRRGVLFLQRYERRKAAGDLNEVMERKLVIHRGEMAAVQEAVEAVGNENHRRLLYRRFILLMQPAEIAAELGTSRAAVERTLYRAIHNIEIPKEG